MDSPFQTRIEGKPSTRFLLEFFGNSAQFPIVNIAFELFVEGRAYLAGPDAYALVGASVTQAYFLSQRSWTTPARRLFGNLIGPTLYSGVEILLEGMNFFTDLNHIAYWVYAVLIGLCQAFRARGRSRASDVVLVVEGVIRTSMLFFMYVGFETYANPNQTRSLSSFFDDTSHQFLAAVVLLLGLSVGLANLTSEHYLSLLRQTLLQLKTYSEWLLGRDLLARVIANPAALNLVRYQRAVLFMDIRNFTRWSEMQTPETVVNLLGQYYHTAEAVLETIPIIKMKLSADEVLVVFASADDGLKAARKLAVTVNGLLASKGLGVGIGLHAGAVVEGLLGSGGVKFYDVIGDTVNTAKRIESGAQAGEILISNDARNGLTAPLEFGATRELTVKGKAEPLTVFSVQIAPPQSEINTRVHA